MSGFASWAFSAQAVTNVTVRAIFIVVGYDGSLTLSQASAADWLGFRGRPPFPGVDGPHHALRSRPALVRLDNRTPGAGGRGSHERTQDGLLHICGSQDFDVTDPAAAALQHTVRIIEF